MTAAMKLKNAGMVLDDAQLEQVTGGLGVGTVLGCLYTAGKTYMSVYKETRDLINSPEYAKMTDKQKNKAIGTIFADNVAFGAMLGCGLGVVYAQTKWRIAGVSNKLRQGVEDMMKNK